MSAFTSLRDIINNVWDSVNSALKTESVGSVPGTAMNVQGLQSPGSGITENPVLIAGQNGGLVKILGLDAVGAPTVNQGAAGSGGALGWFVQGQSAAAAGLAGNPLAIGGRDASGNAQFIGGNNTGIFAQGPVAQNSTGLASVNPVPIGGLALDGTTARMAAIANASADGASNSPLPLVVQPLQVLFNGSSWDRTRNNVDATFLASAARTTTQTSADITTYNTRGITVILDMTVVGTGSVTVTINGKDPASGKYYNLLTGAAVVTNSTNVYRIQEALAAAANKDVGAILPRVIQIVVTANNANSATYSVGYTLHN